MFRKLIYSFIPAIVAVVTACTPSKKMPEETKINPTFRLIETEKFLFNSFVDCNMAEVWIGDTFRIFPGKYGEDPLWGYANELEYADGSNPDEVFLRQADEFTDPVMPPNVPPG